MPSDDTCGVSSTSNVELSVLDATQLAALKSSLDGVKPHGGTPLVGAVVVAYKIQLCGDICDTVRLDAAAHLDVVLGCPAQTFL